MSKRTVPIDTSYVLSKVDIFENEDECLANVLAYVLGVRVQEVKLMRDITLTNEQKEKLDNVLDLLCNKQVPFQYITGRVNIYNEEYIVTPDVLIPRQDTECIIEKAIQCINKYKLKTMLDLCTGSGVIGISAAKNSCIDKVKLLDISEKAIGVAKQNIELNNVQDKCTTIVSDLFTNLVDRDNKYDIITANPPYISYEEYEGLSPYVKQEPKSALVARDNGLYFYIKIAKQAKNFLNNNGFLLFEIGYNEGVLVENILKHEEYECIEIIKDLNSNDRVVICRFQNK